MKPHFTDSRAFSRREFLSKAGMGIGSLAFLDLMSREAAAGVNPLGSKTTHHAPRARAVISLFMHGGPSQVDTFDPKPLLAKYAGQSLPASFGNLNLEFTKTSTAKVLASQRTFRRCGQSGVEMSDIFEHLPKIADELAVVRSCYHTEFNHAPALYMAHSGTRLMGRPSLGAWAMYGLGSGSENLPGYVVMRDGPLKAGPTTYGNGFLPAVFSATELRTSGAPILYLDRPDSISAGDQRRILDFSQQLNRRYLASQEEDSNLSARIAAYELAYRMQSAAPEAVDLSKEPDHIKSLYGLDNDITRPFGTQCLNARRLVERGVRFVQVWSGTGGPTGNWDNHANMAKELPPMCAATDLPIAGLLQDLRSCGLLEDTLVLWNTEFGRMPFAQSSEGRDHNGGTFVGWMAGAGVRPGVSYGQSDEWSWKAARDITTTYDFHATALHLLGLNHERLNVLHQGANRRLTDVHGEVIRAVLA